MIETHLSVFDDLHIRSCSCQPQLAEIALEVTVHFCRMVSFSLRLLDV